MQVVSKETVGLSVVVINRVVLLTKVYTLLECPTFMIDSVEFFLVEWFKFRFMVIMVVVFLFSCYEHASGVTNTT